MKILTTIACLLICNTVVTRAHCYFGCLNNNCVDIGRSAGKCNEGCKPGYSGDYCIICSYCSYDNCRSFDGYCLNGCKSTASYGNRCDQKCPSHCYADECYRYTGNCKQGCVTGYTGSQCSNCATGFGSNHVECVACTVNNCQSCNFYTICDVCEPGFYGYDCTATCPLHCVDDVCNKGDGDCSKGCDLGYEGNKCGSCKTGYYASGSSCVKCRQNCVSCSDYYNCDVCNNGYYGENCLTPCSLGCQSGSCLKSDGTCDGTCKVGYAGLKCERCLKKYFMTNGQCIQCPSNCEQCTSQNVCTQCSPGYYGHVCQQTCAPGCTSVNCNQVDGSCICRDGFNAASNCWQCDHGTFGDDCDGICPNTCVLCSSSNDCSLCTSGYYGSACERPCSAGCDGGCDKHSGKCDACLQGYSGDKCCTQNGNCKSCSSNTNCMECIIGFHSTFCEKECPGNCIASCVKDTGNCNACVDGHFGLKCEHKCSQNCLKCNQNGTCSSCKDGFYGSNCQTACSPNCIKCNEDLSCNICNTGYFGNMCENKCIDNCASCSSNSSCDLCYDGFTGSKCSSTCASRCSSCSMEATTYCSSCARDRYSFHSFISSQKEYLYCDDKCPVHCLYGSCDERTGTCTYGCLRGYVGDICQCPDDCKLRYCRTWDATCTHCNDGFKGATCSCSDSLCSDASCSTCKNSTWYTSSGSCCRCSGTCKDNLCSDANTCLDGCVSGYYGNGCNSRCIDHDSRCLSCTPDSCNQCMAGYFPSRDDIKCTVCSSNCLNRNCSATTGECLEGCELMHWGDDCSKSCGQDCKQCDRHNGTCMLCGNNKFDRTCSSDCSRRCSSNDVTATCDIDNGSCLLGCTTKTIYGSTCQFNCSNTCIGEQCDWTNGQCSVGCVDGYYGKRCENQCSDYCVDVKDASNCDSVEGTCARGCKDGYFANDCKARCGTNCVNATCEQDTGFCIHGCLEGFEGSSCTNALGQQDGVNTGVVAGAAAGGVIFLLVIAAVVVAVLFMRRRRGKNADNTDFSPAEKGGHTNIAMDDVGPVYTNSSAAVAVNLNSEQIKPSKPSRSGNKNQTPHISLTNSLDLESDPAIMDTEEARRSRDIDATANQPLRVGNELALPIIAASRESPDGEEYADQPITGSDNADTYYNAGAIRRVAVDKLADYVANKSDDDFKQEFGSFPKGLVKSYGVSQMPGNVKRNRYNNVYPYDENRVKLQDATSDYINASYVDGFERKNEYIAALGPTKDTTDHFATVWSMIWQQNVEKLVMLTNLQEGPKIKCHQYWPNPGEGETYGDVRVTCMAEDTYAEYTVRTLSATKDKVKRVIYHLHYTGWPDRGVPDDVTGLIEFRNKVLRVKATLDGPVLVHCSAGVGRTGTYIALDYLTNEGEETESVDVFELVSSLRQQRIWMVQAEEQYVYLHDAVVHTLTYDSRPIHSDTFQEHIKSLTSAKLKRMYSHLKSGHNRRDEDEVKAVAKNKTYKNKNSPAADIPGDRYRPRIHLGRTQGECDYINAVYLNSFRFRNHYIVAQTPLSSTVDDFLTLLFQEHIPCIVDMQPHHKPQKNIGEYLPADNQEVTHGDFAIRSMKVKSNNQFTLRRLIITRNSTQGPEERIFHHFQYVACQDSAPTPPSPADFINFVRDQGPEERIFHHFQCVAWQDSAPTPPSHADFINFVREVEAKSKEDFEDAKILIHCLTGSARSCLFPAVSVMLQKMESEQEVSVVNTIRQIQSRRPGAIPDKEQYLFCHECIRAFLDSFDTYSNFAMR